MKYSEAIEYLQQQLPMFQRQGKKAFKKDLKNIKALCAWLGNPEKRLRCIHIAGTNGKGSTAHILAALLQGNNLRVGVYSSPHYKDFRERIKINGIYIPKSIVKRFVKKWQKEGASLSIQPSFFELTVAMAFWYFEKEQLDYVVLETGLGGRLDSTNVVIPILSVITNISFDHTSFLGNTLKRIAKEKAGIIKRGVPVLIGEKQEEIESVFKQIAEKRNSKLYYSSRSRILISLKLTHADPFLHKNMQTALSAYKLVIKGNARLKKSERYLIAQLKNFKKTTAYIGRWQKIGAKPDIFVDSAHNEAGLRALFKFVAKLKYDKLYIVFGMVNDKDPSKIYALLPRNAKYFFAKANIPRGKNAKNLSQELADLGIQGKAYSSVRTALSSAKRTAKQDDLVLVVGSIFVVAEVL